MHPEIFFAQRFIGFDIVCPHRTGRSNQLLHILKVAYRARKPFDERPNRLGKKTRALLKVIRFLLGRLHRCLGLPLVSSFFLRYSSLFRISDFDIRIFYVAMFDFAGAFAIASRWCKNFDRAASM